MLYKRTDDIFEMECDMCQLHLTEVIDGDMPLSGSSALAMAWKAGWTVEPTKNVCYGCSDVSK